MKSLKTKIAASSLIISAVVLPLAGTALAAIDPGPGVNPPASVTINNPQGLLQLISKVIGWIYTAFFLIAIILILFAAFTYLTSGGEPEKVTSAKNQLIYAAVAVAVALLAYGFSEIIRGTLIS